MRGVDDWESGNPLVTVAKHFVTKGCLILGVWGLKHFVWKRNNHTEGEGEEHDCSHQHLLSLTCSLSLLHQVRLCVHPAGREKKQYRVLHNPEKQFKPVHPR